MRPFFPFVETVCVGIICFRLLIARVGRVALIRPSEMGERFSLCLLDFSREGTYSGVRRHFRLTS